MTPHWITLAVLVGAFYALARWTRRHARERWALAFWGRALAARTDVPHMTRHELFASAGAFVTWTLLGVIALQLTLLLAHPAPSPSAPASFAAVLALGGGATAYLLARGLFRRREYLSGERFAAELAAMRYWICLRDWQGLEAHFRAFAEHTCGAATAAAVTALPLDGYREALGRALGEALQAATPQEASLIVYLHRPDDAWAGTFCVYRSAPATADAAPRRLGTCIAEVPGPACPSMAALYLAHGESSNAVALYLIACTVAALGRLADELAPPACAVCMTIESDDALLWLHEPRP